jgi:hypothetical protein
MLAKSLNCNLTGQFRWNALCFLSAPRRQEGNMNPNENPYSEVEDNLIHLWDVPIEDYSRSYNDLHSTHLTAEMEICI